MRVLHINSYFPGNRMHGELLTELEQYCDFQFVYVPTDDCMVAQIPQTEFSKKVRIVYSACFSNLTRYLWPLKILQILRDAQEQIKGQHFDVIHAHSLFSNGLVGYFLNRKMKARFFVSIRNTDVNVFLRRSVVFRLLGAKILALTSGAFVLSPAYLRKICTHRLLPQGSLPDFRRKTKIIPSGVSDFWHLNRTFKTDAPKGSVSILFVGRIDKNKNLGALVAACELLWKDGIRVTLNVVGEGPLAKRFESGRYSYQVRFHGTVTDRSELLRIYRHSDLFVLPSLHETFGLVYIEAMSQGLPILYTHGEGVSGFFPEGTVGFSVDPHSPQDIKEKIKTVVACFPRVSRNASQLSEMFTWRASANEFFGFYGCDSNMKPERFVELCG